MSAADPAPAPRYAELAAATAFSFLTGASHPSDMVARALELGQAGLGIADRNSVAGVVRAHVALRNALEEAADAGVAAPDFKLVVGARLVFADASPDVIAYPATRFGWGRLTRLLTTGNLRAKKGDCILHSDDLLAHLDDLLLIVVPPPGLADRGAGAFAARLAEAAPGRVWLAATMLRRGRDARRLEQLKADAAAAAVPLVAINDALYAGPEARPLHDVMTAIREKVTVAAAGRRLAANAERHLKPPAEMARLFAAAPAALAESLRILDAIHFSLDQLAYEYPHEPVPPGYDAQGWLTELVWQCARERWPDGVPHGLAKLIGEELTIIAAARYAPYFLTVHDIVRFAQNQGILCQGRGSAANSAVCFVLGITAVDPAKHNLLFSRFISPERKEPPDIDVDFEHERREEVMQYIYKRYGRHRAGIAATVIHYRPRSAVREVGKALGLSEDVTQRLTSTVWGSYASRYERDRCVEAGLDPDNPDIARVNHFTQAILHYPRHLSQHVGGFVLTQDRLDETVPIHNAAMADRTFIEWDKDDIDALGLMKIDVLALGMLSCIRKGFGLIARHLGHGYTLDNVPDDAADVFAMLQRADSIGVFQVESRAQMNMLPRLRPCEFYDLVIQVAIVRPGPIQGDMVHPYLRRRQGRESVAFPSPAPPHDPDELKTLLGKTLGVPLFQEQAMKLAIVAAEFTPAEANRLRRAMATFRHNGGIDAFHEKLVGGMTARGYDRDFAEACYRQIEGFGSYGFPESHALAFARLVWVSAYLKCRYPAVFAAALLNAQPMGFYAPAQIVRDARDHGVPVRPVDVNHSDWDCTLEDIGPPPSASGEAEPCAGVPTALDANGTARDRHLALRLGFRQVSGLREAWAEAIMAERAAHGAFDSIEALARRARLPERALTLLADADAFGSLGFDRRDGLWEARRTPAGALPLFAAAEARELGAEPPPLLPAMPLPENVAADYQTLRLSLKAHPMQFLRARLAEEGMLACADLSGCRNGARATVAGVVLVRQRPGKGNAIFVTLEDEGGIANVILWARTFERFRRAVMAARLLAVSGEVQKSPEGVIHLLADRAEDRTDLLLALSETHVPEPELSRADEFARPQHPRTDWARAQHPRNVRILPKSRDFH